MSSARPLACAIYIRKSTGEGLEQSFDSLDAQREACEAYVKSQADEDWRCLPDRYDDGGFSGGSMDRPALQRLMADIASGRIDVVVVYKVDRLTRSLAAIARLVALFTALTIPMRSATRLRPQARGRTCRLASSANGRTRSAASSTASAISSSASSTASSTSAGSPPVRTAGPTPSSLRSSSPQSAFGSAANESTS